MYVSRRPRHADQRPGRGRPPGAGLRCSICWSIASCAASRDDDDPGRRRRSCSRSSCPGTRRSITRTAGPTSCPSSSARTSIGSRPASASESERGLLFYLPGPLQRLVSAGRCSWSRRPSPGWRERQRGAQRSTRQPACGRCCGCGSWCSSASSRCRPGSRISTSFRSCRPCARSRGCGHRPRQRARPRAAVDRRATAAVVGALLLVAGIGLVYLFEVARCVVRDRRGCRDRRRRHRRRRGWRSGSACVGAICAAGASHRRRLWSSLVFVFVLRTLPSFEAYKPVPGFAETHPPARRRRTMSSRPTTQSMPSLVYYLRRHVEECSSTITEPVVRIC